MRKENKKKVFTGRQDCIWKGGAKPGILGFFYRCGAPGELKGWRRRSGKKTSFQLKGEAVERSEKRENNHPLPTPGGKQKINPPDRK